MVCHEGVGTPPAFPSGIIDALAQRDDDGEEVFGHKPERLREANERQGAHEEEGRPDLGGTEQGKGRAVRATSPAVRVYTLTNGREPSIVLRTALQKTLMSGLGNQGEQRNSIRTRRTPSAPATNPFQPTVK